MDSKWLADFQKVFTKWMSSIPINCFVRKITSICINSAVHIGLQQFKHSSASIGFHVHKRLMLFNMLKVSKFVCVCRKVLKYNNYYKITITKTIVKKKHLILSLHLQTSTILSQQFEWLYCWRPDFTIFHRLFFL